MIHIHVMIDCIIALTFQAQPLLESLSELAQHRRVPTRESNLFLPSQHVLDTVRRSELIQYLFSLQESVCRAL